MRITLEQMVRQWAGVTHKFEANLTNAEEEIASTAVDTFKGSFRMKRFNSKGAPAWRPLRSVPNPTHVSLLQETNALRDSITSRTQRFGGTGWIKVFTDPSGFGREYRNKKGKCYAAIHNSGGSIEAESWSPAAQIRQRQFMPTDKGEFTRGDSTIMTDLYEKLHIKIFYGIPK